MLLLGLYAAFQAIRSTIDDPAAKQHVECILKRAWQWLSSVQGRTQDLRFGRSRVHAWGLFAKQDIEPEQFMIEYVGEVCNVPATSYVLSSLLCLHVLKTIERQQAFMVPELAHLNRGFEWT